LRPLILFLAALSAAEAQRLSGELRLLVTDESGAPIPAQARLVSLGVQVDRSQTCLEGRCQFGILPFGSYALTLAKPGFTEERRAVEISSEIPRDLAVTLAVSPVKAVVTVTEDDTLLNGERPGLVQFIGRQRLEQRRSSLPARGVLDQVDTQPGWLLEANGVLHPRGSEYDLQYVVDGIPLFDNRSPAFAPPLSIADVQSMNVLTGGYPAEYGRKLGGVVEINSSRDVRPGLHGQAGYQGGSFGTQLGAASVFLGSGKNYFAVGGQGFTTQRFLDPPVLENYTNKGFGAGLTARYERDATDRDRLRFSFRHQRGGFLAPNDYLQQEAGQRQDRNTSETLGQAAWQRAISASALLNVRAMGRDIEQNLWANGLSIPIQPSQSRGFREAYVNATLALRRGAHEWKLGGEAIAANVRERFGYRITAYELEGVEVFDDDLPPTFSFHETGRAREYSLFAQDQWRWKNLVVNAGLRFDYYRLRVTESAVSPRLAAAWTLPQAGLTIRGSYDRVFQTPAIENLLLASSDQALTAGEDAFRLPVPPSRGNFYEGGFSKTLFNRFRLDGAIFRRQTRNFADDEVFFNTGVSFPIAFDRATIDGVEAKLELPRWGPVSGFASYANLNARASLPVTGGLFLDEDDAELVTGAGGFRITQDQRNTVRSRWRVELTRRFWVAAGGQYGSGLPVELEDDESELWRKQYGPEVLRRVNFGRGRVRPNFSLDLSAGAFLADSDSLRLQLLFDAMNVTNRVNLINFAGLLSGTALQPQRAYAVRLEASF
jgi:outer membrane cobalamin receptor